MMLLRREIAVPNPATRGFCNGLPTSLASCSQLISTSDGSFLRRQPHHGLVRIPDGRSEQRIAIKARILEQHRAELEVGAVITVRGGRIRVSRTVPHDALPAD